MAMDGEKIHRATPVRGKYSPLYLYLRDLTSQEWRASFGEIEAILGATLPKSARSHRAWWANERNGRHIHAKAWLDAGWETANVDMDAETLSLRRKYHNAVGKSGLEDIWPVHSAGAWPPNLSLRREHIYEEWA